MMECVAKGVWKAPGFFEDIRIRQAWTRCTWGGSSPGSIDPLREIMASEHKVKLGVSTLEIESLEINGSDWRQNTIQQGIENELCAEKGLTYIRNLDVRGNPILTLGISGEDGTSPQETETAVEEEIVA
jgi:capsid protein